MEVINENFRVSQFVGHENLLELVEGDIIVPDVKPDILSLIKVEGRTFITKIETQDGKVNIQGMVEIYAIYVADDERSSLKGLNATLNFNESIEVKNCESGMIPIIKFNLSNLESKVLNGRKITVKCPLEISIKVMKDAEIQIPKDVVDVENMQMLRENLILNSLVGCNNEIISINENVSLAETLPPIGEMLSCNVTIVNKDYKISYNKVLVKADAKVRMVYLADDEMESVNVFETLIPFTGFVDIDGINENTEFDIDYALRSYCIKPIYQDMKSTAISVEAEIGVMVIAHEKKSFMVIKDLYIPEKVLTCDTSIVELQQSNSNNVSILKIDENLQIPELDNSKLLEVSAIPTISDKKSMEDKIVLDGNVAVDILFYRLDKATVENKKIEIPFQQSMAKTGSDSDIIVEIVDLEYELNSSGNLKLNMNINVENDVMDSVMINTINSLEITNEKKISPASVVIYPVKKDDSLWSVAKKFGTTIEDIKSANDLVDETIYPMQQLIIPRKVYRVTLDVLN